MAIFSAINAGKARKAQGKAQDKIDNFKYQEIINPYEGVTDLSGMVTNPLLIYKLQPELLNFKLNKQIYL